MIKLQKRKLGNRTGLVCSFCGYGNNRKLWIPRVDSPVSCPKCKKRFDYDEVKK